MSLSGTHSFLPPVLASLFEVLALAALAGLAFAPSSALASLVADFVALPAAFAFGLASALAAFSTFSAFSAFSILGFFGFLRFLDYFCWSFGLGRNLWLSFFLNRLRSFYLSFCGFYFAGAAGALASTFGGAFTSALGLGSGFFSAFGLGVYTYTIGCEDVSFNLLEVFTEIFRSKLVS